MNRRLVIAVVAATLAGGRASVAAQRLNPAFGSSEAFKRDAVVSPVVATDSATRSRSTGGERLYSALLVGGLAAVGMSRVADHLLPVGAAYVVGAMGGVVLASAAREGVQWRPLLLGALAGTVVGVSAVALTCAYAGRGSNDCGDVGILFGGVWFAASVTVGVSFPFR